MTNQLSVESIFTPDKNREAEKVFGANDPAHPSVAYLQTKVKSIYIGGKVQAIQPPAYFDYVDIRFTPTELRAHFKKLAWRKVVAFQVTCLRSIFHWNRLDTLDEESYAQSSS